MVVDRLTDDEVDRLFHALADRTRRDIVHRTATDACSVSALARHYDMSFAAVQKHVAVLERADLVRKTRRGREQLVRTNIAALRTAQTLLDELEALWRDRLDRFECVLGDRDTSRDTSRNTSRDTSRKGPDT
jgi:DNA-binding transcriptional ArsR family regulator